MNHKIAVVLFNLGGPDSLAAVQPFLFNLFSDPDIFKLPLGFITQKPFARFISKRREPEAKKNYAAIGGRSPLLEYTRQQGEALSRALNSDDNNLEYEIVLCMRYWHPLTKQVVAELKEKQFDRVILLPLYPQYSTTTTGSSYNEFRRECTRQHYAPKMYLIHDWYQQPDYHKAIVESISGSIKQFSNPDPDAIELLFSAHGLPQKIVDAGDPYEQHIKATYQALTEQLRWPNTTLCFQSRVGPLKWLQPYTDQIIRQKGQSGCRQMLVYPIAFVSDHVETLYELGIEYAHLAHESGIKEYHVVPGLNNHPLLIDALKKLVLDAEKSL